MAHLLRPTSRNWITVCTLPGALLAGYIVLLFAPGKYGNRPTAWLGLLIFGGVLIVAIVKRRRTRVEITHETISGRIENEAFKLRWENVLAVWQANIRNKPFLNVVTNDEGVSIPLKMFDAERLIELVRLYVKPEAVVEGVRKQLPNYQINRIRRQEFVEQTDQPLRARMWQVKVIGLVSLSLCTFCALMSLRAGAGWPIVIFLFLAVIGVYVILASGTVEMTREYIAFISLTSHHQICWDEVTNIEMDFNSGNIVFYGQNKRLASPGPAFWYGKDREQLCRFFLAQAEWREIEIEETQKAMWRMSKNTKVKR